MPPAAARAVTRGRFRVTQEDAAASPAPRDGADDQRVLRGLQHQSTMVLQRLAELEKAVRSQHRGGDEPPREERDVERPVALVELGDAVAGPHLPDQVRGDGRHRAALVDGNSAQVVEEHVERRRRLRALWGARVFW